MKKIIIVLILMMCVVANGFSQEKQKTITTPDWRGADINDLFADLAYSAKGYQDTSKIVVDKNKLMKCMEKSNELQQRLFIIYIILGVIEADGYYRVKEISYEEFKNLKVDDVKNMLKKQGGE